MWWWIGATFALVACGLWWLACGVSRVLDEQQQRDDDAEAGL